MRVPARLCQAALAALVSLALIGCDPSPSNGSAKPISPDAQIQAIQNNPHMPPEQKEAALARLRAGQATGQAVGDQPNGGK